MKETIDSLSKKGKMIFLQVRQKNKYMSLS